MYIKELELNYFRNYESLNIKFPTKKTIIVGKNAQGKSNLLEAVYYIASLNSNRGASDQELIMQGKGFSRLKAQVYKNDTDITLEVLINPLKSKIIKVNSLKKNKYSEYLGNLVAVNFGITDLLLLRGTPVDRRKWIDDVISKLYPGYRDRLSKYNKLKTQRNNLLKEFKGNYSLNSSQIANLSVWDEQIVIVGSNLIYIRLKFLKEIQKICKEKHKNITLNEEDLSITYNCSILGEFKTELDEVTSIDEIKYKYLDLIQKKRTEELVRAQTLIGPHRDDISFFINGIDVKNFASQGQQRTIVLSLKLAELDFVQDVIKETPILLLDDVLAELDNSRQNFLLDSIKDDIQTIITTVDISNFESKYLKDVTIYNVKSGIVF